MDVVIRIARPRQRPLVFEAPVVFPHHEDLYRRLGGHSVVHPLQPIVKPPQIQPVQIERSVIAEIDGAGVGAVAGERDTTAGAVRPRPDHNVLAVARLRRAA